MTHASRYSASEIAALIGTPWQEGAVGPDAYDCWAAAGMIEERFFGRSLPGLGRNRRGSITRARASWVRTQVPSEGDVVEMRRMGRANHVGVWIAGGILHCQRGAGMVYDRPDAIRAMGWQMRIWTPGRARRGNRASEPAVALYVPGLDLLMDEGAEPEALLAAHRAMPIEAQVGETVAEVIARAGLEGESVAVFLRSCEQPRAFEWPKTWTPDELERVMQDLGAVRPEDRDKTRIEQGQQLVITQVPQGGDGTNPLRLVLQIAVLAAAAFAAPALGGALAGGLGIGVEAARGLAFGVINFAGNFVVNAILPPPSPPALSNFAEEASPTFSARAQASIARPGAPIPIQFGRHIHQLDDISPPFARFEDNAQIIYQLLSLGMGEHLLEEVRLGDTTVWRDGAITGNLPGVSVEHVVSGQPVTLMDEAVFTQGDVTGLTLAPSSTIGWHSAVPAGRTAVAVEIDIAFQQLVIIDQNGNNQNRTVEILVEAQRIDDDDQPLSDPVTLDTLTFTDATRSTLRSSHKWFVQEGRYRLRLTRQTPEGDNQTFDTAVWAGLKGVLPGGRTFEGLELLAVRVEVGEEFAAQSARQVRAVKTRKLPVWNGTAWTAPEATREIAWAVAEIARAHGRLADLDLDELLALHDAWSARGDHFDTVIDQRMSFWEVLQSALRTGRSQADQLGRRIRIWRDEPQPIPRQLFSERNIRRGSLTIRPRLPVSERPERLVAQYMDERTWRPAEIAVGAITGRERRERYFGITNTDHLLREVAHDFRAARFRSVEISFEAEFENRLLRRGDPITLAHAELTGGVAVSIETWQELKISLGQRVAQFTGGDLILISLSAPDGSVVGPFPVEPALEDGVFEQVTLAEEEMTRLISDYGSDPRDWIERSRERDEAIRAVIGPASNMDMRLIIQDVGEERSGYAPITCVDDDPRAQDFPVDTSGSLDGIILDIQFIQSSVVGSSTTTITLSLAPGGAPDGAEFLFENSLDGGLTWAPLGTEAIPEIEVTRPETVWDPGQIRAAINVGGVRSAYFTKVWPSSGGLAAPANLAVVTPGEWEADARLHVTADAVTGASSYRFELRDGDGGTLAILFRSTPELDLDIDALEDLGALARNTEVLMAAVDASAQQGASADLVLPFVSAPGAATGFVQSNNGVVFWNAGTPAPTRGWRIEWLGGSMVVQGEEFWRGNAGYRDPLTFIGLDAFGDGASVTQGFNPEPPPGSDQK